MVALETPQAEIGTQAPSFELKGIDGKLHSLESLKGENGTVVVFMCNHCPFVKAILDKIIRDANELKEQGVNLIAINSNDASEYPEDSFENMQRLAEQKRFNFPYLFDETQEIAKTYGAVCTPDFFGFNADLELQYRGRLDESRMEDIPGAKRDLFEAMKLIAETGKGPEEQKFSIGCSIKWAA